MADYVQIVRVLPRPSPQQISSFVAYVAEAHSWYKHLPLTPPGVQFFFFLDPNAGCDLLLGPGGTAKYRQRTESTPRFHYSWRTTSEYRQSHGYLEYFAGAGTWILSGEPDGVLCTHNPAAAIFVGGSVHPWSFGKLRIVFQTLLGRGIPKEVLRGQSVMKSFGPPLEYFSTDGWVVVPKEILQIGCVELTAVVHPDSAQTQLWQHRIIKTGGSDLQWPDDTGGRATLEEIRKLAQNPTEAAKAQLDRLLEPERQRQRSLIKEAINSMVQLIYC